MSSENNKAEIQMKVDFNANVDVNIEGGFRKELRDSNNFESDKAEVNEVKVEVNDRNHAGNQDYGNEEATQNQATQHQRTGETSRPLSNQIQEEERIIVNSNKIGKIEESEPIHHEATEEEKQGVSFFKLNYSFVSPADKFYVSMATILSIISGGSMPGFMLIFGQIINDFSAGSAATLSAEKFVENINVTCSYFVYIGLGIFAVSSLSISIWANYGKKLAKNIKVEYFKAIMRQEQNWFDQYKNKFEFATKVETQVKTIEQGLGVKVGNLMMGIAMFLACLVIGFTLSWKMSLVMLSIYPVLIIAAILLVKATMSKLADSQINFAIGGGIAEEILYSIKTIASFANFDYEKSRFFAAMEECYQKGLASAIRNAFGMGFLYLCVFGSYALAIWYGGTLLSSGTEKNPVSGKNIGPGDIITILFATIFGAFSLGMAAPNLRSISDACLSAKEFFDTFERIPVEKRENSHEKPPKDEISGNIFFRDVQFSYPSKPNDLIFNGLNCKFESGKKTAIVGESGAGKTTIIHLIERLYDITGGTISIDNRDLLNFDVDYLRSIIGYVAQEPVLFNTTIKDNILFGRNYSDEEIFEACEKAHILKEVKTYGLDYIVGIKGSKLSGGQKQRIAIARAILSKPKILILDEATSALDNQSEKEVQKALDNVSQGVTTIIIAHRLSTIVNSDKILVIKDKQLAEEGTHNELLARGGIYFVLFKHAASSVDALNLVDRLNESRVSKQQSGLEEAGRQLSVQDNKNPKTVNALQTDNGLLEEEKIIAPRDLTPEELAKKKSEEEAAKEAKFSINRMRLLSILGNHKCLVLSAIFGAFLNGVVFPAYGLLLGLAIDSLSSNDPAKIAKQTFLVAMYFIALAGGAAIANFMQSYFFNSIGEALTTNLRKFIFEKYLSMDLSYYDVPENTPGALQTKLAGDTTKINGIALSVIGVFFQTISTLIVGLVIGFYFDWRLTLINILCLPIMIMSSVLQNRFRQNQMNQLGQNDKEAGSILSESVVNTKTIFCFNMQSRVVNMFDATLESNVQEEFKASICEGVAYGFSQLAMFSIYAIIFFAAGQFIKTGLTLQNMFSAIMVLLFSGFGIGQAQQYVGDYTAAKDALDNLYETLDIPTTIITPDEQEVPQQTQGQPNQQSEQQIELSKKKIVPTHIEGRIEFINVSFSYPTMPDKVILSNVSFIIEPGQKIAFVGPSGCGKSTIVQLIERYYDVTGGEVKIDGVNIKDYDVVALRKCMSIVMQEPTLFKRSIYENIRYGKLDATEEEVLEAARNAFIEELVKKDYDNDKEISGGQKQRVAIARAVIKKPSILMLDEATSALDKESETIVQQALDNNLAGRTSISIAHRLITIKNSDKIFVIDKGTIIESGNHNELMALKNKYYLLWITGESSKSEETKKELVRIFAK